MLLCEIAYSNADNNNISQLRHVFAISICNIFWFAVLCTPCLKKPIKIVHARTSSNSHDVDNFWHKDGQMIKLCQMHSLSTSPNLCQPNTVLKTDVPNCYVGGHNAY